MKAHLQKNKNSGKLIVFEGTDGAGKTTLIELCREWLAAKYGNEKIICLKQPTDLSRKTKLFQKMMYSPNHQDIDYRAVQLLTLSDRLQHDYEVIRPLLSDGKIVICDRYLYTSIANMFARGYKKEKWFFEAAKQIVRPNIIFLITCPAELAIRRIKNRAEECDRYLNEELLKKVREEFLRLGRRYDFQFIDTDREPTAAFGDVKKILEVSL